MTVDAEVPRTATLGLLSTEVASSVEDLRLAVLWAELHRRLPECRLLVYSLSSEAQPRLVGGTATVSQPLLAWDDQRAQRLSRQVDAIVLLADPAEQTEGVLRTILEDLRDLGVPLLAPGRADQPGDVSALGARLFDPALLPSRLEWLRAIELVPSSEPFVLASLAARGPAAGDPAESRAAWSGLESAARGLDAELVVLGTGPSAGARLVSAILEPIDLVALVASAAMVVTDDPALLSLAAALASPIVALGPVTVAKGTSQGPLQRWAETYGVAVSDPTGLVGALGPTPAGETESRAQRLLDDAEGMLDALADAAATLQAAPKNPVQELADLRRQLRTVESANAGLRALLGRERAAFAALVPPAGPEVTGPASHPQSQRALREARQEVTRLRFELDALYATRTLRAVQPARRLYAKLRSRRT